METEAFSVPESGMDLGSSPGIFPSDATDVGTSGISSQKETSTTDLTEGQKFAKAQAING